MNTTFEGKDTSYKSRMCHSLQKDLLPHAILTVEFPMFSVRFHEVK